MKFRSTLPITVAAALWMAGCSITIGPTLQPTYSADTALQAAGITFEPTATPILATLTPTPNPSIALKGGYHTLYGYPEIGFPLEVHLKAEQTLEIIARVEDNSWLQIQYAGKQTAWLPAEDFDISNGFDLTQFPVVDPYPQNAPAVLEWKGGTIRTLCLSEQTVFTGTYAAEHPDAVPQPVFSANIVAVMHAAGIQTMPAGGACDATLLVGVSIDPRGKQFTEAVSGQKRYCYSGVNIDTTWQLLQGDAHLKFDLKKQRGTRDTQIVCIREGKYDEELGLVMHTGLDRIWGASLLTPMLQVYDRQMNRDAIYLAGAGGRHRIDAVPALFPYLSDPDLSDNALSALKTITGKGFVNDLYTWTSWWEQQALTPTPTK